jgi:hypothetical protein
MFHAPDGSLHLKQERDIVSLQAYDLPAVGWSGWGWLSSGLFVLAEAGICDEAKVAVLPGLADHRS